jgi:phosphoribosylformylglycinamidine synthase
LVLGICNGFQILLEAGLLPGAMRANAGLRFLGRDVFVRVERDDLPFTRGYRHGQVLRLPVAHAEGNYSDTEAALDGLEQGNQVVFRYCNAAGDVDVASNPNGSLRSIAGICNAAGNVCALMPHPERAAESILGNSDGLALFTGLVGNGASEISCAPEVGAKVSAGQVTSSADLAPAGGGRP